MRLRNPVSIIRVTTKDAPVKVQSTATGDLPSRASYAIYGQLHAAYLL